MSLVIRIDNPSEPNYKTFHQAFYWYVNAINSNLDKIKLMDVKINEYYKHQKTSKPSHLDEKEQLLQSINDIKESDSSSDDDKLNELQQENERLKRELAQAKKELEKAHDENDDLRKRLEQSENQCKDLQHQLDELLKRYDAVIREFVSLYQILILIFLLLDNN